MARGPKFVTVHHHITLFFRKTHLRHYHAEPQRDSIREVALLTCSLIAVFFQTLDSAKN